MADWIACPRCLLKHSRRPDGLCPKCHESVDGAPAARQTPATETPLPLPPGNPRRFEPAATALPLPPPDPPAASRAWFRDADFVSGGARLAGAILIANAIEVVLERVILKNAHTGSEFGPNPISALLDLWIGGSLLAGKPRFLPWARWRVIIGGLIFSALHFARGDTFLGVFQLVFSISLLALLIGRPARLRIGTAAIAAGLCLSLEAVGLISEATGENPLARLVQPGRWESQSVAVLQGNAVPWQVRCPDGWYPVRAEVTKRENPAIDRWISKPEQDTHLYVIAERLEPGSEADMDAFERAFLKNARATAKSVDVLTADPPRIESAVDQTRFLHTVTKVGDVELESYIGLFAKGERIAQVVAMAPRRRFAAHRDELRKLLESFHFVDGAPRPPDLV